MALPENTPAFAAQSQKSSKSVTVSAAKRAEPDPRKIAAQEYANALKARFDALDALQAADELVAAKEKALDAQRRAAAAGKRA
jgi:hypothetical protein